MIVSLSHAVDAITALFESVTDVKVASVAAVIAIFAITWPLRYQRNAALLDQAVLALKRAYNALTDEGAHVAPVPVERLNWLTAARNLETYKALKKKIRVRVHRRIVEDHEEHWRHRFYLALQGPAYHQPSFYQRVGPPAPREQHRDGIEIQSAIIVHAFANWPKGRRDPLDQADFDEIFSSTDPRPGNVGLKFYMDAYERFSDLPEPYPDLTWWRRALRAIRLRKRL